MLRQDFQLKMKQYEGFNYPYTFHGNVQTRLQEIRNLRVRCDDVFITSYPKSGTHLLYEITHMLLQENAKYSCQRIWLDFDDMETINQAPSPRILVTHIPPDKLPRQLLARKAKILNLARNPKDVAVSFYFFLKTLSGFSSIDCDINSFIKLFLKGEVPYDSWFRYVKDWYGFHQTHCNIPMLFLQYEDMNKDLYAVIERLANFLNLTANHDLMKTIEQNCQLSNMRKHIIDNLGLEQHCFSDKWQPMVYRKGEVGDWKRWFTESLNDDFERIYHKEMEYVPLEFTFTL